MESLYEEDTSSSVFSEIPTFSLQDLVDRVIAIRQFSDDTGTVTFALDVKTWELFILNVKLEG